jgi:5'-nucleotidase
MAESRIIVLTNDDGAGAPGLEALKRAVGDLGLCRVVAPAGPRSGCGHAVSTGRSIAIHNLEDGDYAIDGTPADCARMAIDFLVPEATLVLSGINAGGNLGVDVYHSGTVAAAREAVLHGLPAIAFSRYIARDREVDWNQTERWTADVLRKLLEKPIERGAFWNVNFPHRESGDDFPEIVYCELDLSPLPLSYRVEGGFANYQGDYHGRARRPGGDIDVCLSGRIAATLVRLKL